MAVQESRTSTRELLGELISDVRHLIRQDVALARAELHESLTRATRTITVLGVAAGTLTIGALWILVALTRGLADLVDWPVWAGYAVVGGCLSAAGVLLLGAARRQAHRFKALPRTRDTLRQQAQQLGQRGGGGR